MKNTGWYDLKEARPKTRWTRSPRRWRLLLHLCWHPKGIRHDRRWACKSKWWGCEIGRAVFLYPINNTDARTPDCIILGQDNRVHLIIDLGSHERHGSRFRSLSYRAHVISDAIMDETGSASECELKKQPWTRVNQNRESEYDDRGYVRPGTPSEVNMIVSLLSLASCTKVFIYPGASNSLASLLSNDSRNWQGSESYNSLIQCADLDHVKARFWGYILELWSELKGIRTYYDRPCVLAYHLKWCSAAAPRSMLQAAVSICFTALLPPDSWRLSGSHWPYTLVFFELLTSERRSVFQFELFGLTRRNEFQSPALRSQERQHLILLLE